MTILGLPIGAWLIIGAFLAFCLFIIGRGLFRIYMRIRRAIVPLEPTEAAVAYIRSRYDKEAFSGPYMVYISSDVEGEIGFNGVVTSFKEQFGDVVRGQAHSMNPDDWPTYINRFNKRPYKEIILEMQLVVR